MDDLAMHGALGGAISVSGGYAHSPLRVATPDGAQRLTVVSDQAFADVGLAITWDRLRWSLHLTSPLLIGGGRSGVVGGYQFTAPAVDAAKPPDALSDARLGIEARLIGQSHSAFRLGLGAQLYIPNDERAAYDTDGTFRAVGRALVAGDSGPIVYAAHVGVHVRPLDDSPTPGSPQGSELLFGLAGGPRLYVGSERALALVVGPELFGATAARSLFRSSSTAFEALASGRVESAGKEGPLWRVKLGVGGGINARFGAPEWRLAFAIEVSSRANAPEDSGAVESAAQ